MLYWGLVFAIALSLPPGPSSLGVGGGVVGRQGRGACASCPGGPNISCVRAFSGLNSGAMVRRLLLLLGLLLALNTESEGQGFRGVAALGAMHPNFPCDSLLKLVNQSPRPALGVLWDSFGQELSCVAAYLNSNKNRQHLLEIHFSNEVCRRNKRCTSDEFLSELSVSFYNYYLTNFPWVINKRILDRVFEIRDKVVPLINKNTILILTTGLEDNFTDRAYLNLYGMIRPVWPFYMARNPVRGINGKVFISEAKIVESHILGSRFPSEVLCMVSEDGNQQQNADSRRLLRQRRGCLAVFLWRWRWQNAAPSGAKRAGLYIPPREREFRITPRDVREVGGLLR